MHQSLEHLKGLSSCNIHSLKGSPYPCRQIVFGSCHLVEWKNNDFGALW
ncbi:unnamed protein product [Spirodela intermedia]|uniref:Uncharacterized protein n=1 Tax=Spirodela intermedia TaxID=51605 RepID=A0A7I8KZX0_SPIIN|nr:unnamed protein product [Spirodela intermedia]